MSKKTIEVVELFAGVGGFRIGLEGYKKKSASSNFKKRYNSNFQVVWSNQWEPGRKNQFASRVYENRFGIEGHTNIDITEVKTKDIPNHDLLVGGFPCQDYSVASSLVNSKGLMGKKGVLWWQIYRIIKEKGKQRPKYLLLENVDRLLNSPAKQRGRDFAIMLQCLNEVGYAVEWKVINAAEYGMPQKRRRVFILAYHKSTSIYKELKRNKEKFKWFTFKSLLNQAFPCLISSKESFDEYEFEGDVKYLSDYFNKGGRTSPFKKSGFMVNGVFYTINTQADYTGPFTSLNDILDNGIIEDEFFVNNEDLERWQEQKGAKKIERTTKEGYTYIFSEGEMKFPDDLDEPARTIITSEGGSTPSRSKHIVKDRNNFRRLTPVELERANMFPDNFTKLEGVTNAQRAFLMGNALVIGIVEKIGKVLEKEM